MNISELSCMDRLMACELCPDDKTVLGRNGHGLNAAVFFSTIDFWSFRPHGHRQGSFREEISYERHRREIMQKEEGGKDNPELSAFGVTDASGVRSLCTISLALARCERRSGLVSIGRFGTV